jgi:CelD/BcsL family acetyltransferase involved in cellulose biosynthesis
VQNETRQESGAVLTEPRRARRRGGEGGLAEFRIITNFDELEPLQEAWDRLAFQSAFVHVFATFGFCRSWWRAFGGGRTLRVVLGYGAEGDLRFVGPFCCEDSRPDVWRFIGGNVRADYGDVIAAKHDRDSLSAFLRWLREQRSLRTLLLSPVPADAAILDSFDGAYDEGSPRWLAVRTFLRRPGLFVVRRWQREHSWFDRERLERNARLLDKPSYQDRLRLLSKEGPVSYECLRSAEAIRARLPEFMEMHIRQWAAKGEPSLFQEPANRAFYEALIEELAGAGGIRLDIVQAGRRLVAAHFGFTWARRVYFYKPCYERELAKASPGKVLLAFIFREARDSGASEVDFLRGREEYKLQYGPELRITALLAIHRSGLRGLLGQLLG